jgi:hypothetical protein
VSKTEGIKGRCYEHQLPKWVFSKVQDQGEEMQTLSSFKDEASCNSNHPCSKSGTAYFQTLMALNKNKPKGPLMSRHWSFEDTLSYEAERCTFTFVNQIFFNLYMK